MFRAVFLALLIFLCAACGPAATDSGDPLQPDLERGALLGFSCVVCHTLGPGEEHLIGPNLNGIFGRAAASAPGFEYSPAMKASGIVWTPAVLDSWLAEPAAFLPGNNMPFAGFSDESDRNALLAYLVKATGENRR